MRAGYSRRHRLTSPQAFQRARRSALKAAQGAIAVQAVDNGLAYARLGLAVGRKAVRTAVARNLIKRLVRETFRRHKAALTGLDVVVTVRNSLAAFTHPQVLDAVESLFRRITACKGC